MDPARPSNSKSLVSLQEAAQLLGVPVHTLLTWNEHNILKPTITPTGHVGYTQEQIQHFLEIRQSLHLTDTTPLPAPISLPQPHTVMQQPTGRAPRHRAGRLLSDKRFLLVLAGLVTLLAVTLLMPDNATTALSPKAGTTLSAGDQTSRLKLSERTPTTMPVPLGNTPTLSKSLHAEGDDVLRQKSITQDIFPPKSSASSLSNKYAHDSIIATLMGQRGGDIDTTTGDIPDAVSGSSGLSVLASQRTCTDCADTEESASAFDENGNIKSETKPDAPATLLEKIGSGVGSASASRTIPFAKLSFLLPLLGAGALMILLRRQFAVASGILQPAPSSPTIPSHQIVEKVLEVAQKTDGTVVILFGGKEFKISKPELYSESDQFIERLMELTKLNQKELEYDVFKDGNSKFATPLSRLVTRLGFVGIKRDLFFPRTSKQMVLFRRYITSVDLADMNLTPSQVLKELTGSF